jgi:hypothetical protein
MGKHRFVKTLGFMIGICCPLAISAQSTNFTVTLDTSPLIGHPAGPFSVDFQLNDGSGVGDSNNTAILTNFEFGGGAPTSSPSMFGGAIGDLSTGVTITEPSFFNDFQQQFTPGSILKFTVQLTLNPNTPQPDEFSFAILDSGGNEIATLGPADALLMVVINSMDPAVQTYSTDPSIPPVAGGPGIDIPAAMVASVPEPTALSLVGLSVAGLLVFSHRRRK